MKTPFEILDIPENSDDITVKKAYLRMVRQYPPERFPEAFQRVRAAYELIKTQKDRLRFSLFDTTLPAVDELIADIRAGRERKRPDIEMMRGLLKDSLGQVDGTLSR
jgi:DnaJ-class molecular chaperone